MPPVQLTLACNLYDRSLPILAGVTPIEGCEINFVPLRPEEAHWRAFDGADFDVTEMSMGSQIVATAQGGSPYVCLPAFVSRAFRHNAIFVRADRGIETGADLKGKTIGVPEYQMTAATWIRGILSDDFGVAADQVAWRTGGLNEPGRKERMALNLPASFDVKPIGDDVCLSDALASGQLDAIVTARNPACFERGHPQVKRLFADYRAAEQDYFRRTGIFPLMHGIGIRKNLVEQYPWLPRSVFKAFLEAKNIALARLREVGALPVSHPWMAGEIPGLVELMGKDFWPYGVEPNRKALETLVRYSREQGLIDRDVSVEELIYTGVSDKPFAI